MHVDISLHDEIVIFSQTKVLKAIKAFEIY